MPQFSVYINANASTKVRYPYLLDVQSPLLENLETRVVIPLAPLSQFNGKPIANLSPILKIQGNDYIIFTAQMAGVHRKHLGDFVFDASEMRPIIIQAIDFLITGF